MTQELVQHLEGGRTRMARGYLAQEIEVVSNEDHEVPREGRLGLRDQSRLTVDLTNRPDLSSKIHLEEALDGSQ